MQDKDQKCIACKSDILVGAKKCLACGSRQDWLRFFDLGNTSLSMLIAAFSVLALGADNILKLSNLLQDSERGEVTVKISAIDPNEMIIFFDNDGPGNVVYSMSSLCSIYPTAKEYDLHISVPGIKDSYSGVRYPKHKEVLGRYVYTFGNRKPIIIKAGENRLLTLSFHETRLHSYERIPTKAPDIVKSYCTFSYLHENGKKGLALEILESIDITYFALDREDVQKAFSRSNRNKLGE